MRINPYFIAAGLLLMVFSLSIAHSSNQDSSKQESSTQGSAERYPAKAEGLPVMAAVGRVGNQVITSREIQMAYLVEKALLGSRVADLDPVATKSPEFQKALSQTLLEYIVTAEAENFDVAQITQDDLKRKLTQVKSSLRNSLAWAKLQVTEEELEVFLSRKLRTTQFLKFKTESSGVAVTDAEAMKYFEKNRVKFGNLPFSNFKEGIKEYLAQEMLTERLKDWFEVLKRKYRVQYL